jgi:hypothetical protein
MFPNMKASENPAITAIPILVAPPSSYATGIIDSASITRIAPAANDKVIASTEGSVYDDKIKPIAEEIVPINTTTTHKISIDLLLLPLDFIPSEDDKSFWKIGNENSYHENKIY